MSEFNWRPNTHTQLLGFREYIRRHLPGVKGDSGLVVEDIDLLCRVYGSFYEDDQTGRFIMIELKFGNAQLKYGQKSTYKLIVQLLRKADPKKLRFMGFYQLNYSDEDWEIANFWLNNHSINQDQLHDFLQCRDIGIEGLYES